MVRPSARSTLTVSSLKWTPLTRSPAFGSEVAMPRLQEMLLMFRGKRFQSPELPRWKAKIECQPDRLQPEFGG